MGHFRVQDPTESHSCWVMWLGRAKKRRGQLRPRPGFESRRERLSRFFLAHASLGRCGACVFLWRVALFFGGFALGAPLDSGGTPHLTAVWPSRRVQRPFGARDTSPRSHGSENRIWKMEYQHFLWSSVRVQLAAAPWKEVLIFHFPQDSGINRTLSSALPHLIS